jgi:hypothetical protein
VKVTLEGAVIYVVSALAGAVSVDGFGGERGVNDGRPAGVNARRQLLRDPTIRVGRRSPARREPLGPRALVTACATLLNKPSVVILKVAPQAGDIRRSVGRLRR